MRISKPIVAVMFALFVLTALLAQISRADVTSAANSTAKDKLAVFMSEVIGLDLTKYNITNEGYGVSYPSEFGGLVKREHVIFTLDSSDSKIEAGAVFDNGFIYWINFNPLSGSMIYTTQPSTDALVESRSMLQRYQAFAQKCGINASHITSALNLLSSVPDAPPANAYSGNFNSMSDFTPPIKLQAT